MKSFLFALILLCLSFPVHAELTVLLSSSSPRPGDTLRVEIDGDSNHPMAVVWNKKKFSFYPIGPNAQRALIGVKLGQAPGVYPLHLEWRTPSTDLVLPEDQAVQVASRTYQVEDVVFSASKTRQFNENLERRESAKIHQVLLQLRSEQYWEGRFDPPVDGPIEGVFGVKRIRNHTIEAGFHKGVDLRAAENTPVKAANGGIVVLAHAFRIHGRTIIIDHGQGVMTIYLHMKSLNVVPGNHVAKGDVIGHVGSTGLSTAPHVHWGLYVHSVPVDPAPWLEKDF